VPCYRPVKAYYGNVLASGKREIVFSSGQAQSCLDLKLPCGSCVGCRLERSRQWAMRCMDEASLHKDNSFITLTFNDANLPQNRSLDVSIFQKFMKRLRKEVEPLRLRFFIAVNMGLSWVGLIITRLYLVIPFLIVSILRRPMLMRRFTLLPSLIVSGVLDTLLSVMLHLVVRLTSHDIILRRLDQLYLMTITQIYKPVSFFPPSILR